MAYGLDWSGWKTHVVWFGLDASLIILVWFGLVAGGVVIWFGLGLVWMSNYSQVYSCFSLSAIIYFSV